jgi:hypothetical protein
MGSFDCQRGYEVVWHLELEVNNPKLVWWMTFLAPESYPTKQQKVMVPGENEEGTSFFPSSFHL